VGVYADGRILTMDSPQLYHFVVGYSFAWTLEIRVSLLSFLAKISVVTVVLFKLNGSQLSDP